MHRNTKSIVQMTFAFAVLGLLWLMQPEAERANAETTLSAPTTAPDQVLIDRGRYLVNAMGCTDCHTPLKLGANGPERDMDRYLSGHPEHLQLPAPPVMDSELWMASFSATMTAWSGPWGITYTRNLTPDIETGLGSWTQEEFVATARSGRHRGRGRALLPPMPVEALDALVDDDLVAIFEFLRSLPPIRNHVPEPLTNISAN